MNDAIPPIAPIETNGPAGAAYKNRSNGLAIFGVFNILLGLLCALFVPVILFGAHAAAKTHPVQNPSMLPIALIYGGLAVMLVWLGIGSIQARRWARALLLIFSWVWFIVGVFTVAVMSFVLPKAFTQMPSAAGAGSHPATPPGFMLGMMIGTFVFMTFIMVVLPAVWLLFYKSPNVKATCEARHPVAGWTDACPLPVLALCLLQWLAAPMCLLLPITAHGLIPFFGMFLTGVPGSLYCLLMGGVSLYAGWRLYRLEAQGWWLILTATVLYTISSVLTYTHHDVLEMYRLMNYPPAQIERMQKSSLLVGNHMIWFTVVPMVLFVVWLLCIKKYFRGANRQG